MHISLRITLASTMLLIARTHTMMPQELSASTTVISFDLDEVASTAFTVKTPATPDEWNQSLPACPAVIQHAHANDPDLTHKLSLAISKEKSPLLYPIPPVIDLIKKLKSNGYTVVAATNKTFDNYLSYAAKMFALHNIDFSTLFDAVLTTLQISTDGIHRNPPPAVLQALPYLYQEVEGTNNVYAISVVDIGKPNLYYYSALRSLIWSKKPYTTKILHIDDNFHNVMGANSLQPLIGLHFNVDPRTADHGTLMRAIAILKTDLNLNGVWWWD